MYLSREDFESVVRNAPLVSIDLLVEHQGKFLLGLRRNRPAKGYLFVPGGRIHKGESLADAFARIVKTETGLTRSLADAAFVKVSEHHYPESMFDEDTSTHYVVLSYRLTLNPGESVRSDPQHDTLEWLSVDEMRTDRRVHTFTVQHFEP